MIMVDESQRIITISAPWPTRTNEANWRSAVTAAVLDWLRRSGPSIYEFTEMVTQRVVKPAEIRQELLEGEWESGEAGQTVRFVARVPVTDHWAEEDRGGWQRVWYTVVAEPAEDGRATRVRIAEEE